MLKNKIIKIYGLPRSGTNFLEFILKKNFNVFIPTLSYGWKHGEIKNKKMPSICIIKEPFSWLTSIYKYAIKHKKIFHIKKNITLEEFLKTPYVWDSDIFGLNSEKVYIEYDNPITCWNIMNNNWLENCNYWVQYESLLIKNESIMWIEKKFNLKRKNTYFIWPSEDIKPGAALNAFDTIKCSDSINKKFIINSEQLYEKEIKEYITSKLDKELLKKIQI